MGRNGPKLWDALLDAVRPHTTRDLIVAGGCLRDHIFGLEPKDIDLFVAIPDRGELEQLGDTLSAHGFMIVDMIERGNEEDYDEAFRGDLIGVLEGEAMGIPVNIIARSAHLEGRDALLDSFDFNILKAWHDGDKTAWRSEFLKDEDARTATLAHQRTLELSKKRFARFAKRNPGVLKMVDPWQLDFAFE